MIVKEPGTNATLIHSSSKFKALQSPSAHDTATSKGSMRVATATSKARNGSVFYNTARLTKSNINRDFPCSWAKYMYNTYMYE